MITEIIKSEHSYRIKTFDDSTLKNGSFYAQAKNFQYIVLSSTFERDGHALARSQSQASLTELM